MESVPEEKATSTESTATATQTSCGSQVTPIMVPLASLRIEAGFRQRAAPHNEEYIERLAEAYKADCFIPPITAFKESDGTLPVGDGLARAEAARRAGKTEILATVCAGGHRAAFLHSLGANEKNGERRSNADRGKAVTVALGDPELAKLSNTQVADYCGVSDHFVREMRHKLAGSIGSKVPTKRLGKDGKLYTQKPRRTALTRSTSTSASTDTKGLVPATEVPITTDSVATVHSTVTEPVSAPTTQEAPPSVGSDAGVSVDTLPAEPSSLEPTATEMCSTKVEGEVAITSPAGVSSPKIAQVLADTAKTLGRVHEDLQNQRRQLAGLTQHSAPLAAGCVRAVDVKAVRGVRDYLNALLVLVGAETSPTAARKEG